MKYFVEAIFQCIMIMFGNNLGFQCSLLIDGIWDGDLHDRGGRVGKVFEPKFVFRWQGGLDFEMAVTGRQAMDEQVSV